MTTGNAAKKRHMDMQSNITASSRRVNASSTQAHPTNTKRNLLSQFAGDFAKPNNATSMRQHRVISTLKVPPTTKRKVRNDFTLFIFLLQNRSFDI